MDQRARRAGALFTAIRRRDVLLPSRARSENLEVTPFHRVWNGATVLHPRDLHRSEPQGRADRLSGWRESLRRGMHAARARRDRFTDSLAAAPTSRASSPF